MLKSSWIYLIVAVVLGTGGWFYYSYQHTAVQPPTVAPNQAIVVPSNHSDEELNKQREKGIGSIKDLKPVPIDPKSDRKSNN